MKTTHDEITIDIDGIDQRAEMASGDNTVFERLLKEFKPFLHSRVSRLAGSLGPMRTFDEMLNDSYLAFYKAVRSFNREKGHFFPFMRSIVHKRLIDSIRRNYTNRVATIPLENNDEDGVGFSSQIDEVSKRVHLESDRQYLLRIEIESFNQELAEWGITMDRLVAQSPKHSRLRNCCREVIDTVALDEEIMEIMWEKHCFPVKKISNLTEVSQKTIKRARIFIIGSLIIRAGDYDYLKEYVTDRTVCSH